MRFVKLYLKEKQGALICFFLCALLLFTVFSLCHLPLGAVLYPALLCSAAGLWFLLSDFFREKRKYRRLLDNRTDKDSALPPVESLADAGYQALIGRLQKRLDSQETLFTSRRQDLMDYYGAWVHQIKTPISSMQLSLQNEDSALSRKLASDLLSIEQYVDMALTFLRLDSDSSDYVFRSQPIDPILRQAVARFSSEFIGRKLALEYEPLQFTAVTDEKWLSFVFGQILSNALKYTRRGGIRIYGKVPCTVCIADTGIGIAPEDLPRIFEKGYTGYNGRADKRASGLGLYLCRRVCDNLGAQLSLSSVPGEGTCVSIRLDQYEPSKE